MLDVVGRSLAEQVDEALLALHALRGDGAVAVLLGVADEVVGRAGGLLGGGSGGDADGSGDDGGGELHDCGFGVFGLLKRGGESCQGMGKGGRLYIREGLGRAGEEYAERERHVLHKVYFSLA